MTKEVCVLETAEKIFQEWQAGIHDQDVSHEEGEIKKIVYQGICPLDGNICRVRADIIKGKVGKLEIVTENKDCEVESSQ